MGIDILDVLTPAPPFSFGGTPPVSVPSPICATTRAADTIDGTGRAANGISATCWHGPALLGTGRAENC